MQNLVTGAKKVCKTLAAPGTAGVPGAGGGGLVPVPTPVGIAPTPAPGSTLTDWNQTATPVKDNLGGDYLFFCPPAPNTGFRSIYGDYLYTTDSALCVAGVHAAIITKRFGGNIRFRIKGSANLFFGSLRNEIESNVFGSFDTSYQFVDLSTGAEIVAPSTPPISAAKNAGAYYTFLGSTFSFICPPQSVSGNSVWGTDIYTYDSSICRAAIHAGKISNSSGGQVTILILPGQESYSSSARNGVSSNSYGSWGGSYSFQ